jgi:hypothetical protein
VNTRQTGTQGRAEHAGREGRSVMDLGRQGRSG